MGKPPYFHADYLGDPREEFVAWIDVMGIQNLMKWSIKSTANFVYKTHIAALEAKKCYDRVVIYPVMDGFYVSCDDLSALEDFIIEVMSSILTMIIYEEYPHFRFLIRGGISFGEVYHGRDLEEGASDILYCNPQYKNAILLGQPMIDAHIIEKAAPPLGLAVHASLEHIFSVSRDAVSDSLWWPWFKKCPNFDQQKTMGAIDEYFDWYAAKPTEALYSKSRISEHRDMANRYFNI